MVKETESYERIWAKERQAAVNANARTWAKEELAAADAPATTKSKKHVKSKSKNVRMLLCLRVVVIVWRGFEKN